MTGTDEAIAGDGTDARASARSAVLSLLDARAPGATVCPSEVARALARDGAGGWRDAMPAVHAAVDALLAGGLVRLSWKGAPRDRRAGPYRIGRPV